MKIENDKIIIELSEKEIKTLELACNILDTTVDDEINSLIYRLSRRALSESMDNVNASSDTVIRRINIWAERKDNVCHKLIGKYLMMSNNNENPVSRIDFQQQCNEFFETEVRFVIAFRSLCSDSLHAYGKIFDYDRDTRTIKLNDKYLNNILEKKEKFLDN